LFIQPLPGTYGNAGRNMLQGPGLAETDLSLAKKFPLSEQLNVLFRAEFFNVLNHNQLQHTESGRFHICDRRTVAHGRSDYGNVHYLPANSAWLETPVVKRRNGKGGQPS
jgi:hypothetical protein